MKTEFKIRKEQRAIYLSRRRDEITILRDSLIKKDFGPSLEVGHRLKGNAKTFGFDKIGEIGLMMEAAAKEENFEKVKNAVDFLNEAIKEEEVILKRNEAQ